MAESEPRREARERGEGGRGQREKAREGEEETLKVRGGAGVRQWSNDLEAMEQ